MPEIPAVKIKVGEFYKVVEPTDWIGSEMKKKGKNQSQSFGGSRKHPIFTDPSDWFLRGLFYLGDNASR